MQSALNFLGGRNLLQSVMIANEVVDEARRNKKRCMIFKVDFEKAYALVCWKFLIYMMRRNGFQ